VSPLWQHNCSSDFKMKVRSSHITIILSAEPSSGFITPKINNVKQQRSVGQNYVFVTSSKREQKYRDYFDPNNAVQLRVMGMKDTVVCVYMSTAGRSYTHRCWSLSCAGVATSRRRHLIISYTTESCIETDYLRPTRGQQTQAQDQGRRGDQL
jgi:hypothetical protein